MKITEKIKKAASKIGAAVAGAATTAVTTVTAWAADEGVTGASVSDQVMQSVQGGFTDAKEGIGKLLVIAIPIVIGIIVAVVLAKSGFGWVKTIGSKSKG